MREYFAQVCIGELEEFISLWNKRVLDVGGARGEFCKIINKKRNCDTINLDPYPDRYIWSPYLNKSIWPNTKIGFADNMPFEDNEFDIVICRGVLEHIPKPKQQQSINEIYRVLKKKEGIGYVMISPWYNPNAGHELKPFHVFPFRIAKYLREAIFKKKINVPSFEEASLYPITFRGMLKMLSVSGFKIVATKDTHLRLHFLTRIPIIREMLIPSVVFILRKR